MKCRYNFNVATCGSFQCSDGCDYLRFNGECNTECDKKYVCLHCVNYEQVGELEEIVEEVIVEEEKVATTDKFRVSAIKDAVLNVRIENEIKNKLEKQCIKDGVTKSEYVNNMLQQHLKGGR